MKNFEMRIVGDCRGYFFKNGFKWEDESLIRGLGRIRVCGCEVEEEEELWGWREDMSIEEVVDWLESDCIGGGEEVYVEIKVDGEIVYENEVGIWEYDNIEEDEYCDEYDEKVEKEFGEDWWEKEDKGVWYLDRLKKMK